MGLAKWVRRGCRGRTGLYDASPSRATFVFLFGGTGVTPVSHEQDARATFNGRARDESAIIPNLVGYPS